MWRKALSLSLFLSDTHSHIMHGWLVACLLEIRTSTVDTHTHTHTHMHVSSHMSSLSLYYSPLPTSLSLPLSWAITHDKSPYFHEGLPFLPLPR